MIRILARTPLAFTSLALVPGWCWVEAFTDEGLTLVIFTQARPHHGPSLTNNIERVIARYTHLADLENWPDPTECRWIEHYSGAGATFDEVHVAGPYVEPNWIRLTEDQHWALSSALGELEDRYECQL